MKQGNIAIVILLVALAASNVAWYVSTLPKPFNPPNDCYYNGNVYDCRRLSTFREVIVNVTNRPLNMPLPNVTVQLYTFDLKLLSENVTDNTGIVIVKFPYNGTFYIELSYWIYFRQGGIEKYHKWSLFTANTHADFFTMNLGLGPADWPTTPQLANP